MSNANFTKDTASAVKNVISKLQTSNLSNEQAESLNNISDKINNGDLTKLSKEEVEELQNILEQSGEKTELVQQLSESLNNQSSSNVLTSVKEQDSLVSKVVDKAQAKAFSEFEQGVGMGVKASKAIDDATEVAYKEALQLGASKDQAKTVAIETREALTRQIMEDGKMDEVAVVKANQVEMISNLDKISAKLPVTATKEDTSGPGADMTDISAGTVKTNVDEMANNEGMANNKTGSENNQPTDTSNTQPVLETQPEVQDSISQSTVTEPDMAQTTDFEQADTQESVGSVNELQNLQDMFMETNTGDESQAEHVLDGPTENLQQFQAGSGLDANVQAGTVGGGDVTSTRVQSETLGSATAKIVNSEITGDFVSQTVDVKGQIKTEKSELGALQEGIDANDENMVDQNVGSGNIRVDTVQVEEIQQEEQQTTDLYQEIPPAKAGISFIEIDTDPAGEKAIIHVTVDRDHPGHDSEIALNLTGLQTVENQDLWDVPNVYFDATEVTRTVTLEFPADLITYDESLNVELVSIDPMLLLGGGAPDMDTKLFNDPAPVSISTSTIEHLEDNTAASHSYEFIVTRARVGGQSTFNWTLDGLNADDFGGEVPSGTLTFDVGETSKTITIDVPGDKLKEIDELLKITVDTDHENLSIDTSSADTLIVNDDSVIRVDSVVNTVDEGTEGEITQFSFEVSRDIPTGATSVDWVLSGNYNAENIAGQPTSGTIDFAEGQTSKIITFSVPGDVLFEESELYTITLKNPGDNASIDKSGCTCGVTVKNDDFGFNLLTVTDDVSEGNLGQESTLIYKVVRSAELDQAAEISYKLIPLGSESVDSSDFSAGQDGLNVGLPSGKVLFAAGETEKLIEIKVNGDNSFGADETLSVVRLAVTSTL